MPLHALQNEEGSTALSIACQHGRGETAEVLLDHGAAIDYQDRVRTISVHTSQGNCPIM